ncbi:hypothetical protein VNO77_01391 [Canavalia gladiata]|uniref:MADS-box domain-containing protein n=1 Tax=Canavalia gladiata TaxID=3824 RepID=A0AAN9MRT0_CANGL
MGRRKIEITLVKDPNSRQVTFSKRRTGLFKKANEISILCGAEVAIVVFSPGNKPYSFGHPGVDAVAAQYLQQEPNQNGPFAEVAANSDMDRYNQMLNDVMGQLHEEERKGAQYDAAINGLTGTQFSDLEKSISLLAKLKSQVNCVISDKLVDIDAAETMMLLSQKAVALLIKIYEENEECYRENHGKNDKNHLISLHALVEKSSGRTLRVIHHRLPAPYDDLPS